jgi:hypothetical protein
MVSGAIPPSRFLSMQMLPVCILFAKLMPVDCYRVEANNLFCLAAPCCSEKLQLNIVPTCFSAGSR